MNNYFERCCKRLSKSTVSLKKKGIRGNPIHIYCANIDSPDSDLNDTLVISKDLNGSCNVYFNTVEVPLTNEEKKDLYERARIQYNVTERKIEEKILEKL
jgi:hypothetical protein